MTKYLFLVIIRNKERTKIKIKIHVLRAILTILRRTCNAECLDLPTKCLSGSESKI